MRALHARLGAQLISAVTCLVLGLVLGLTVAATPASAVPGPEGERATRGPATLDLQGRGFGHGRGLSQYGAQAAASDHGRTFRQILDFYYPGTRLTKKGGSLRVLLTVDPGRDVMVVDQPGLVLRAVDRQRSWSLRNAQAQRWRLTPDRGGDTRLSMRVKGRWRVVRVVKGEAEFQSKRGPMRLVTPSGTHRYAGTLRSAILGADRERGTVNVIGLEAYLRGVVPEEVPALWHPQAVRAQAVAARTFAAFERASRPQAPYHLCDTSACQVYAGVGQAHPAADRAIKATKKIVVGKSGRPIFAQFSASNGGWSTAGSFSYLKAQRDPWDDYGVWTHTIPATQIEAAYPAIGDFQGIRVLARDGNGAWGGRATTVRIEGTKTSTTISGDTFRVVFGLRSTWFRPV